MLNLYKRAYAMYNDGATPEEIRDALGYKTIQEVYDLMGLIW